MLNRKIITTKAIKLARRSNTDAFSDADVTEVFNDLVAEFEIVPVPPPSEGLVGVVVGGIEYALPIGTQSHLGNGLYLTPCDDFGIKTLVFTNPNTSRISYEFTCLEWTLTGASALVAGGVGVFQSIYNFNDDWVSSVDYNIFDELSIPGKQAVSKFWSHNASVLLGQHQYPYDLNEGSGFLVYPNQSWMNCPDGIRLACQYVRRYANCISTAFPLAIKEHGFIGNDGSKSYIWGERYGIKTPGFNYVAIIHNGNLRELDHEHLGRITHLAYRLAKLGFVWAKKVMEHIVMEVRQKWLTPNTSDGNIKRVSWWSVDGFLETPEYAGKGSEHVGRDTGHVLTALAYGVDLGLATNEELERMIYFVEYMFVFDLPDVAHMLYYKDPVTEYESNAWERKLQDYLHEIPPNLPARTKEKISLVVGFEEVIIACGLFVASQIQGSRGLNNNSASNLFHIMFDSISDTPDMLQVFYEGEYMKSLSDTRSSTWVNYFLNDPLALEHAKTLAGNSDFASNPTTLVLTNDFPYRQP